MPDVNPTHAFSNFTSQVYYFNVELVAFSSNGCTDTSRQIVTVYPSIDASFTLDPAEGCNPTVATMQAIPGGSNYFWDYGDGNAENAGAFTVHQFNNTGTDPVTYTVSLTTTSFYGCIDTKTQDIHFQETEIFQIILFPLNHRALRHRCILDRHQGRQWPV